MQPALEQNSGAAEFQHFVDFLVNLLEREDVAVLGAERPVEGAEGTILGAEIRVVDVAVDLVGDDAGVVFLQAHLVRSHAEAHEVIGFEHFQSLLFRQSQELSSSVPKSRKSRFLAPLGMTTKGIFQAPKISRLGAQPAAAGATTTSRLPLSQWPTRWAGLAESSRGLPRTRNTIPGRGDFPHPEKNRCCFASTIRGCAVAIPILARRQNKFRVSATNRNLAKRENLRPLREWQCPAWPPKLQGRRAIRSGSAIRPPRHKHRVIPSQLSREWRPGILFGLRSRANCLFQSLRQFAEPDRQSRGPHLLAATWRPSPAMLQRTPAQSSTFPRTGCVSASACCANWRPAQRSSLVRWASSQ